MAGRGYKRLTQPSATTRGERGKTFQGRKPSMNGRRVHNVATVRASWGIGTPGFMNDVRDAGVCMECRLAVDKDEVRPRRESLEGVSVALGPSSGAGVRK